MNEACLFCKFDHCDICKHNANQVNTPSNLAKQGSGDSIIQSVPLVSPHRSADWQVGSGCNTADTSAVLKDPTECVQTDKRTASPPESCPGFPKGSPFGASIRQSSAQEVSGDE